MRLDDIPAGLPISFRTDLAQLIVGARGAIRSELRSVSARDLTAWARRSRFCAAVDRDGYFSVARSPAAARRVLRIDALPGPHVFILGRALGYPTCCCLAAARRGEDCLDEWSTETSSARFRGRFTLINPQGYGEGRALISHIPCSPRCLPSLRIALAVLAFRDRSRPDMLRRAAAPTARLR